MNPTDMIMQHNIDYTIASLMVPRNTVHPDNTIEQVGHEFFNNHDLQSLPVIQDNKPVGIAYRYQLMDIFLSKYGRDLHGKKPISEFMDITPLIIDHELSIEKASHYITQNILPTVQDFIITIENKYYGMGTLIDLLKGITNLKTQKFNYTLAKKVQELEKRTNELTIAHMQAKAAIENAKAANKAKSRFLANMSHELRTPINAILGYTDIIQEDLLDLTYDNCVDDLTKIDKAGKHLLDLISNILDVSKIESGKMTVYLEYFNCDSITKEIATMMRTIMAENSNVLKIECNYHTNIHSDLIKFRQCIINLLSNANKFSHNNEILLSINSKKLAEKTWIVIKVIDNGAGMTQEQMNRLFNAFTQADDSTTRKYGGTGLGLTITKQFCELLGGSVAVESELNKGSTFTIYLPV